MKIMATIKVAYDVNAKAFAAIKALAAETVATDVNWNGAEISVERDEFTCVECNDEIAGTILLRQVFDLIDQH